jgi:hypothetical protein
MKEFIQRIRTLDEAGMLSPMLLYTTIPASTVGTRDGLAVALCPNCAQNYFGVAKIDVVNAQNVLRAQGFQ